jgi:hypothetical protein
MKKYRELQSLAISKVKNLSRYSETTKETMEKALEKASPEVKMD